jgi:hypothetical protein
LSDRISNNQPSRFSAWRLFVSLTERSPLFELAGVLIVLDHVALTDLTHLRIFPRNLASDFTHYLSERLEISTHDEESQKPKQ